MVTIDMRGRTALVAGVANHRSLAWGIAQDLAAAGARLALTYQGDRLRESVEKLTADIPRTVLVPCDVGDDAQIDDAVGRIATEVGAIHMLVHSIAFAAKEDLEGVMSRTTRAGFRTAMEVSAYSFVALARAVRAHMPAGGSMVTLSFLAAERVFPNYNILGAAKAALEHHVRQLASEFGPDGIRVNAVSAGPVKTLASAGISRFGDALQIHRERAPLRRNVTKEEVGHASLFLLSDLASGITGETLHVDAGYSTMGV
jgi:enoyl-[acyl-carrier protein] reductase I